MKIEIPDDVFDEAIELVNDGISVRAAANYIGIPVERLRYKLNPDYYQARARMYYRKNGRSDRKKQHAITN